MTLFTKEMIENAVDDGCPDGTIILASKDIKMAVKAMALEIVKKLPSVDRVRVEKVLWRRLIDNGQVTAIINIGQKH